MVSTDSSFFISIRATTEYLLKYGKAILLSMSRLHCIGAVYKSCNNADLTRTRVVSPHEVAFHRKEINFLT